MTNSHNIKSLKDLILFIDHASPLHKEALRRYGRATKCFYKIAVLRDHKKAFKEKPAGIFKVIYCDLSRPLKIAAALQPYQKRLAAAICTGDKNMAEFAAAAPYLPYLRAPSASALRWSVDKVASRQHFYALDPKITPQFLVVQKNNQAALRKIKAKLKFPVIIKPANLSASQLVTVCFHAEELEKNLRRVWRQIKTAYKNGGRLEAPSILVEEFMEGDLYSLDAYVTSRGRIMFCPLVRVKTGRDIGFDDFFGYQQLTPTLLKSEQVKRAEEVAAKAIRALSLASTSAHVELLQTADGFKVVEVAPRLGGFRHKLYWHAFGIDHALNDILVRLPKKISLPKKIKGYSAAMKFFAKEEGRLQKLKGLKKIKTLKSFVELQLKKRPGDRCYFAKNGDQSVFNLIMFNKNRSALLADIRRAENLVKIVTAKTKAKPKAT